MQNGGPFNYQIARWDETNCQQLTFTAPVIKLEPCCNATSFDDWQWDLATLQLANTTLCPHNIVT